MSIVLMTYGAYNFTPVPFMNIHKEYSTQGDSKHIGTIFKVSLDGNLVSITGGLAPIEALQSGLRSAFATEGLKFQVTCDGSPLWTAYPRIKSIDFPKSDNNWVFTSPFTIDMEWDDDPQPTGTGSNGEDNTIMPPFISDAKEDWSVEVIEDKSKYSLTLTSGRDTNSQQLRLTHNLSAVGKRRYTGSGLNMEAWQQAQSWVLPRLSNTFNSTFASSSGVLNIDTTTYSGFNHVRSNQVDVGAGSFTATESWIIINPTGTGVAGNAIEDFTVTVRKGIENDFTTVSIEGSIQGLESRTYGTNPGDFNITQNKYDAAIAFWNTIKDTARVYPRAIYFAGSLPRTLNTVPLNKSVGHNPVNGVVTYAYEYNDRPSNCISGALTESITITDNHATDVFAEIPILGRSLGPILQSIGTYTSAKREVSIEVVMAPSTGCTVALLSATNPKTQVDALLQLYRNDLNSTYSQVFTHTNTESWNPKDGRYSRQIGWTFPNGNGC